MAEHQAPPSVHWGPNAVRYDTAVGDARDADRARRSANLGAALKWVVWIAIVALVALVAYAALRPSLTPQVTALDRLKLEIGVGDRWGDAAALLAQRKDPAAEAYYAVARLLDPTDTRWREQQPRLERSVDALAAMGVRDDALAGAMARQADAERAYGAARLLYDYAAKIDPARPEWRLRSAHAGHAEKVAAQFRDDEVWGDVADSFSGVGDARAAEECYAVARLVDPNDAEWLRRRPDLMMAVGGLERFGISQAAWVGERARTAESLGALEAGARLYELAGRLAPAEGTRWKSRAASARLRLRLPSSPSNDELWGDLGDAYAAAGDDRANGAYGVAALLDGGDREWQEKTAHVNVAPYVVALLRDLRFRDDEWIGRLGGVAQRRNQVETAAALYRLASELDPADTEWARQLQVLAGTTAEPAPAHPEPAPPEPAPVPPAADPTPPPPPPVVVAPKPAPVAPATLRVRSSFPVLLRVGPESRGTSTAHEVRLDPGAYRVALEAAQVYYRSTQDVVAAPGGVIALTVPELVRIQVAAVPADARLYINGWYARALPGMIQLTTGRHDFEFQWPALGRSRRQPVDVVQAGQHVIGGLK